MAIARWMAVGLALLVGADAAWAAPALKDEKDKRSYALGVGMGKQLRSQAVEVDPDIYLQGLKDAMSGGKTLLTEAEARATVHRLQVELKQKKTAQQREKVGAAAAAGGLEVSFRLDPRITKGLYMGDRWVSQASYPSTTAPDVEPITVPARASGGAGAAGKKSPSWTASNPEMVTIWPSQGGEVKLSVRSAGESTVTVKVGERSSSFTVKAAQNAEAWRVDLSSARQVPPAGGITAAATAAVAEREDR